MNRNQQLLDKLLTALDLKFVNATEGMEDGWYIFRSDKSTPVEQYNIINYFNNTKETHGVYIKAHGQFAGPILGR